MMEGEFVRKRHWITEAEFLDRLAAASLILGPSSKEIAIFIGQAKRGWAGLVIAGCCFIIPAAGLVTLIAAIYVRFGSLWVITAGRGNSARHKACRDCDYLAGDGREACRIAAWLDEANEATSAVNARLILLASHEVAVARKIGSGILGLARSSHQRGLRSQVAGFGLARRRGHFSPRFRPRPYHIVENRGIANESAASGRRARPAAPMAVNHSSSNGRRLGVRIAVYQRRTSILAWPTAQDSHQTGCSKSGFAESDGTVSATPVSAWGKEAGLEMEDVKTLLRHENIATTSDIYGDLGLEAKRRIQQRL